MEALKKENDELKKSVQELKHRLSVYEHKREHHSTENGPADDNSTVTMVVLGASGDLAKKKTFPSLFALFNHGLLPKNWNVIGYARTEMTDAAFRGLLDKILKGDGEKKKAFMERCFYHAGLYDNEAHFEALNARAAKLEQGFPVGHRMFYYAIPPSVFVSASRCVQAAALSQTGWTRVIVEKPFGKDLSSSNELGHELAKLFREDQIYRIDHYLGKELVQNLMVLRFANSIFEPLWSSVYISNVQITFKEDIGTEGRGGYFDEFGILRDVMQNHLTQILSLVAMEPPLSLDAEDVRDEKVKLLRAIPPVQLKDLVIGQYGPDPEKKLPGYLDDPGVPKNSVTPTFATAVLYVNNSRWQGVPFILKCGKALDQRKAEIRIQFRLPTNGLFSDSQPNELVLRVQPNEAIYLKMISKKPGLTNERALVELDLSFKQRFAVGSLPDAYERLILDVLRGDHNLFVRADELQAAWKIFTPILHRLEKERIPPIVYKFGTRGPPEADELTRKVGFVRNEGYVWPQTGKL
jgi:glucose-6-phosphate 1-dehydrogenase